MKENEVTDKDYLISADKYGLGKERDVKEYFKFANIDFGSKTTEKLCGKTYNKEKKVWE